MQRGGVTEMEQQLLEAFRMVHIKVYKRDPLPLTKHRQTYLVVTLT